MEHLWGKERERDFHAKWAPQNTGLKKDTRKMIRRDCGY